MTVSTTACEETGRESSGAVADQTMTVETSDGTRIVRLSNGLRVLLRPDHRQPVVSMTLALAAGSRYDPQGGSGTAHLAEHLLFEGSRHAPLGFHREAERLGGEANGATDQDRMWLTSTWPAHQLEIGLWLESDRLAFPSFSDASFEAQVSVVRNERLQRVEANPYNVALERLWEMCFPPGHGYRRPVIGYAEDLETLSADGTRAFLETYATPQRSVLAVVGDFCLDRATAKIDEFFSELPVVDHAPPEAAVVPLAPAGAATMRLPVPVPTLYLAFAVPGFGTRDWLVADLLASWLAGGRRGELAQDLQRRGTALQVRAQVARCLEGSMFFVSVVGAPGIEPARVRDQTLERLEDLVQRGPDASTFESSCLWLLNNRHHDLQSYSEQASWLALASGLLATYASPAAAMALYRDIGSQVAAEAARSWLRADRGFSLLVEPS